MAFRKRSFVGFLAATSWLGLGQARADERSLELGKGVVLPFVEVPAGTFRQGSPADETGREDDEVLREVTLTRAYYLSKYPITVGDFSAFVNDAHYRTEAEKGDSGGFGWDGKALVQKPEYTWKNPGFPQTNQHPVVIVTYDDALAFARWAEQKSGEHVRLPTEAELERAARGTETKFGTSLAEGLGFFKTNAGNGTRPVGEKPANGLGLFGIVGNVNQWTSDFYAPRTTNEAIDPEVREAPAGKARRVLKGGSWNREPRRGRPAARYANTPGTRNADNGFRLAFVKSNTPNLKVGAGSQGEAPLTLKKPDVVEQPSQVPEPSSGPSLAPILIPLGLVAGAGALYFLFAPKRSGAPGASGGLSPKGVTTRTEADGFVIVADLSFGSRVKYEAFVKGVPVGDVVPIEGPETFVYTGGAPEMIRIVEVLAATPTYRGPQGQASSNQAKNKPRSSHAHPSRDVLVVHETLHRDDTSTTTDTSTPFVGNPSAY